MNERKMRRHRLDSYAAGLSCRDKHYGNNVNEQMIDDIRRELEASERDKEVLAELEETRARVQGRLCEAVDLLRSHRANNPAIVRWLHETYSDGDE